MIPSWTRVHLTQTTRKWLQTGHIRFQSSLLKECKRTIPPARFISHIIIFMTQRGNRFVLMGDQCAQEKHIDKICHFLEISVSKNRYYILFDTSELIHSPSFAHYPQLYVLINALLNSSCTLPPPPHPPGGNCRALIDAYYAAGNVQMMNLNKVQINVRKWHEWV